MSDQEIIRFQRRKYYLNFGHEDTLTCRGTPRIYKITGLPLTRERINAYQKARRKRLIAMGLTTRGTVPNNPAGRPAVC